MMRDATAWLVLFSLAGLLLAGCASEGGPGYPASGCYAGGPCMTRGTTGPYDEADRYVDAQGNPIPGWAQMKYGPESGESR